MKAKSFENAGFFGMQRITGNEEKSRKDELGHTSALVFSFGVRFDALYTPIWADLMHV